MRMELEFIQIEQGTCYVLFAFDVGAGIDLHEADRRIAADKERPRIRYKLRAPQHVEYRPPRSLCGLADRRSLCWRFGSPTSAMCQLRCSAGSTDRSTAGMGEDRAGAEAPDYVGSRTSARAEVVATLIKYSCELNADCDADGRTGS